MTSCYRLKAVDPLQTSLDRGANRAPAPALPGSLRLLPPCCPRFRTASRALSNKTFPVDLLRHCPHFKMQEYFVRSILPLGLSAVPADALLCRLEVFCCYVFLPSPPCDEVLPGVDNQVPKFVRCLTGMAAGLFHKT